MKTGYNGRKRFSLLDLDGTVFRFGCCDPKIDSGRTLAERDGIIYLVQDLCDCVFPTVDPIPLLEATKVCNGYYDTEHDGWLPVREYYERFMK